MSALMGTPIWRAMGERSSTRAGTSFTSTRSNRRLTHAGSLREFESRISSLEPVATSARIRSPSSSHGTTFAAPRGTRSIDLGHFDRGDDPSFHLERVASHAAPREPGDVLRPLVLHRRVGQLGLELVARVLDVAGEPVRSPAQAARRARVEALGEPEDVRRIRAGPARCGPRARGSRGRSARPPGRAPRRRARRRSRRRGS